MTIVKSLLLSSAAGLLAVAGAQAADLPSRKAAPVEYVKVCSAYGAGFFFLPGTDTCVRIGGYVRAEYQFTPGRSVYAPSGAAALGYRVQSGADQDETGMEMRGRIDVDGRTQTAWGTAQTVVMIRGTNANGIRNSAGTLAGGYPPAGNLTAQTITTERAYVRFAGFTFGTSSENFVSFPSFMYHGNISAGFPNGIKQLAYTATFGGGFSATVAIEARSDFQNSGTPGGYSYINRPETGFMLVGNIRADQAWGYVRVSGAVGQASIAATQLGGLAPTFTTITGAPPNNPQSGYTGQTVWAIGLGAKINLPMLAAGDAFYFTTAYAKGIQGLTGCSTISSCSNSSNQRINGGVLNTAIPNAILTSVAGGVGTYSLTTTWNVTGLIQHFWTPQLRSNFEVGYNEVRVPTAALSAGLQYGNMSIWGVLGNLIWSPVNRLDIGVELAYYQNTIRLQNALPAYVAAGSPGTGTNGNWSSKLRVERLF